MTSEGLEIPKKVTMWFMNDPKRGDPNYFSVGVAAISNALGGHSKTMWTWQGEGGCKLSIFLHKPY